MNRKIGITIRKLESMPFGIIVESFWGNDSKKIPEKIFQCWNPDWTIAITENCNHYAIKAFPVLQFWNMLQLNQSGIMI